MYTNPNTHSVTDYDLWLDADYSRLSLANRVWVPDLPVRATTVRDGVKFYLDSEPDAAVHRRRARSTTPARTWHRSRSAGNAFFVSGVYYFENTVTFEADRDLWRERRDR